MGAGLSGFLLLVSLFVSPFNGPGSAHAAVFGDGNAANGTEDDRRDLAAAAGRAGQPLSWPQSAGTIRCEGQVRGSALLVDAEGDGSAAGGKGSAGAYLVTAAHVLLAPDSGRPFQDCEFQFMGLGALPGYQVALDPQWVRSGPFDPSAPRDTPEFGRNDWALLYLPGSWAIPPQAGRWPLRDARVFVDRPDTQFHLVAWARESGRITVSGPCRVVVSRSKDLGMGGWPGHLLDDCDSEDGASGGGLLATTAAGTFLVGIRSGSHHDPRRYPTGPAPGEPWAVSSNTNYARAVDQDLIAAFRALVLETDGSEVNGTGLSGLKKASAP